MLPNAQTNSSVPRLEIRSIEMSIGARVILDKVSFSVAPGEIVGILGPNGSGKTSLMRCITGLWQMDRGGVFLNGTLLNSQNRSKRADIGVVFQDPSLDIKLTALENLVFGGRLHGMGNKEARLRADELLKFIDLENRKTDLVQTFSGGMKRRLELARALINEPNVLLLDEPTNGLDPIACKRTWERLLDLRKERDIGMVISTHQTEEATRCDRLIIFDSGRVSTDDTTSNILGVIAGDVITFETSCVGELVTYLGEHFNLTPQKEHDRVVLRTQRGHELIPRIVEAFPPGAFKSISLRQPSLADAFQQITGRSLNNDEGEL